MLGCLSRLGLAGRLTTLYYENGRRVYLSPNTADWRQHKGAQMRAPSAVSLLVRGIQLRLIPIAQVLLLTKADV